MDRPIAQAGGAPNVLVLPLPGRPTSRYAGRGSARNWRPRYSAAPSLTCRSERVQRRACISLRPAADHPDTASLIPGVDDGIYVVGDRSWSIDMQRYNFQFTGQRAYRIRGGKLAGQVKDVAYQATTTDFRGSMEAVG
ncbi:metallopeptidase TldD-related protein [Streptacidiphilus pinicola]|uniref:metallopeptidase TldD-related protein n=1 Tax=Streptacidiphilus pinicola TaxID=2219663 RepID=UPI003C78BBAB